MSMFGPEFSPLSATTTTLPRPYDFFTSSSVGSSVFFSDVLPGKTDMLTGSPFPSMNSPIPTIGSTRCSLDTPRNRSPPSSSGKSISQK